MDDRTDAAINAALIVIGGAAVLDNVIFHWLLGWHRLIEDWNDPEIFLLELGVVLIGFGLFTIGVWREMRTR